MDAHITIREQYQDLRDEWSGQEGRLRLPTKTVIEMLSMPPTFFLGGSTGPIEAKEWEGDSWRVSDGYVQEVRNDNSCLIVGWGEPTRISRAER